MYSEHEKTLMHDLAAARGRIDELREKIASLEKQLAGALQLSETHRKAWRAALAPPAQTQRPDLVRLAHLYEHSDPDCEIPGCSCCPALIELLNKVAAPLTLEKQPSPAAAPAQLSELATAQRGLDEWCKAAMQERARADAAEARLAALAGQPAPTGLINQCDGCRAGRPIDKNGNHRMGDGDYPNLQACQRHLYYQPAPTDDQKALRAAALEEAAQHYADPQLEDTNTKCRHVAQFLRRLAAGALAGSPAQQGQLGKKGGGS